MSSQWAVTESGRCLSCYEPPCTEACPVHVDVAGFIRRVKSGDLRGAFHILGENLPFPNTCALVCPHLRLCEGACCIKELTGSIRIGALQHFVATREKIEPEIGSVESGKRVAIIGSGPTGLSAANGLRGMGHCVTVFEKESKPGGLLTNGIPPHRLPKDVAIEEIANIKKELDLQMNERIDGIGDLINEFDAVLIATGAHESLSLGIPGEELAEVVKGLDFIERLNDGEELIGKKVAIIGGGDVAIDAARCAIHMGAESVRVIYRRSFCEMPAYSLSVKDAKNEGVWFLTRAMPIKILGDDRVKSLECIKTELGEPDASGRGRPIPVPTSQFVIDVDIVVLALGQRVERSFIECNPKIKFAKGLIKVDDRLMTSQRGVFAAGDATNGGSTVVQSIADGRRAAAEIGNFLEERAL